MSRRSDRQAGWRRAMRLALPAYVLAAGLAPPAAAGTSPQTEAAKPRPLLLALANRKPLDPGPAEPDSSATAYADLPDARAFRFRTDRRRRHSTLALLGEIRGLRQGVGLDYRLTESGKLHLNLYSGRDGFGRGRRWSLGSLAPEDGKPAGLWSLGASADLVRFRRGEDEQLPAARVVLSPQLMLDVDGLTGLPGNCDLMIQHSLWRSADERATADQRVVQFVLKWKF